MPVWDLVIRNGRIVDGTGSPWFEADIAVKAGRVVAIGKLSSDGAVETVDAGGFVVTPGFIDAHGHSDASVLANPKSESKIRQGVTTEVMGNCGDSLAPLYGAARASVQRDLDEFEIQATWRSFGQYLAMVRRRGTALNLVPLVGHTVIRQSVIGFADREATARELDRMRELVALAMRQGARGLSSGLFYPPASFAPTSELVALTSVVAEYGGVYTSHIRNEGDGFLSAVAEAIRIAEEAGLPLELSHHKAAGQANWGDVRRSLSLVEEARERGVDVSLDVYPYTAASLPLRTILPAWALAGGATELVRRLKATETRAKLAAAAEQDVAAGGGWERIVISSVRTKGNRDLLGLSLAEAAAKRHSAPLDLALDLLVEEEGAVEMARFLMCEEDVSMVLAHPLAMICSDATSRAPYGVLAKARPHPRAYGTFARVLGHYWRERRLFSLETAVHKMTGMPAARFGLWDRGLLRPGSAADIVIFDADSIADVATYAEPHQFASGVERVFVNGVCVVKRGAQTDALPGRVLTGSGRRRA